MAASYDFHPEALLEYAEAAQYYVQQVSSRVAAKFVRDVEFSIAAIAEAPDRWRVVDEPAIRRYVLRRFPFVLYYRWKAQAGRVTIYAVMHCSREPDYWRRRLPPGVEP